MNMMQANPTTTDSQPNAPIGIFDSGLGGLTVAQQIASALPHESLVYLGDTLRCPYGPRNLDEVRTFVRQICSFLEQQHVKLIVIACNTGTAAGLTLVQQEFDIPIIGVIEPGARAAVHATRNRRVGVIGTAGTINSGSYENALHALDAGIEVFSAVTPRFVDIVEAGLLESGSLNGDGLRIHDEDFGLALEYLAPLKLYDIDTLILGCTHYPLLAPVIGRIMGRDIELISSAEETAQEVMQTLERRGQLSTSAAGTHKFYTTGGIETFSTLGSLVFGEALSDIECVSTHDLQRALISHDENASPSY